MAADFGVSSVLERPRVFISYRRQEAEAEVICLNEAIDAAFGPESVFVDRTALRGGDKWWEKITGAIAKSSVMIVVIGPAWLRLADEYGRRLIDKEEDWVRNEILHALRAQLTLIPMLLNGATLPPKEALPPCLQPIRDYQTLTLELQNLNALKRQLIERLTELGFGRPSAPPTQARPTPPEGDGFRRTLVFMNQLAVMKKADELANRAFIQARRLSTGDFADSEERRSCEAMVVDYQAAIEDLLYRERSIMPDGVSAILHHMKYDMLDFLRFVRAKEEPDSARGKFPSKYADSGEAFAALSLRREELLATIKSFIGV